MVLATYLPVEAWVRYFDALSTGVLKDGTLSEGISIEIPKGAAAAELPVGFAARKKSRYSQDFSGPDATSPLFAVPSELAEGASTAELLAEIKAQWYLMRVALQTIQTTLPSLTSKLHKVSIDLDQFDDNLRLSGSRLGRDPGIADAPFTSAWDGIDYGCRLVKNAAGEARGAKADSLAVRESTCTLENNVKTHTSVTSDCMEKLMALYQVMSGTHHDPPGLAIQRRLEALEATCHGGSYGQCFTRIEG